MNEIIKKETYYRGRILDNIVSYIHTQVKVTDILFAGDLNSAIHEDNIQEFYNHTGLYDIFSYVNDINEIKQEPTFIWR